MRFSSCGAIPEAREVFDRGLALAPVEPRADRRQGDDVSRRGEPARAREPRSRRPQGSRAGRARRIPRLLLRPGLGSRRRAAASCCCRLTPSAFDDDAGPGPSAWPRPTPCRATPRTREPTPSRRRQAFEEQLASRPTTRRGSPPSAWRSRISGRKEEAIREGERGVALAPISTGRAERSVLSAPARRGSTSSSASTRRRSTSSSRC